MTNGLVNMMRTMKRGSVPTLSDIASSAGVSKYTVSVVLNGARSNTRVSEETRRRITEEASRLGYYPNAMAQGLRRRRINTVGVLIGPVAPSLVLADPYTSRVLQGILAEACDRRCDVTLFSEPWQGAARQEGRFRDGRTDGVIIMAPVAGSNVVGRLTEMGVLVVTIAYPGEQYNVPSVDVDNAAGIRMAVQHLVELGHRRIAHLTGDEDMASVPLRREAFRDAMLEAGLPIPDGYISACHYNGSGAGEATEALLSLPNPPTAIVGGNDAIAIGAMGKAQKMGLRVPEDLSIIGYDDAPSASFVTPALTTIRQPLHDIGAEAMRLLQDTIDGKIVEGTARLFAPELVVRETTGKLLGH